LFRQWDVRESAQTVPVIDSDNGILATVPGNYIGAALNQCPDPRTARADVHQVVVDAAWAGRVLITCHLTHSRKFWTAVRADRVKTSSAG